MGTHKISRVIIHLQIWINNNKCFLHDAPFSGPGNSNGGTSGPLSTSKHFTHQKLVAPSNMVSLPTISQHTSLHMLNRQGKHTYYSRLHDYKCVLKRRVEKNKKKKSSQFIELQVFIVCWSRMRARASEGRQSSKPCHAALLLTMTSVATLSLSKSVKVLAQIIPTELDVGSKWWCKAQRLTTGTIVGRPCAHCHTNIDQIQR